MARTESPDEYWMRSEANRLRVSKATEERVAIRKSVDPLTVAAPLAAKQKFTELMRAEMTRQEPDLTPAAAQGLVLATAAGRALWDTWHSTSPAARTTHVAAERNTRDPNAPTKKAIAGEMLQGIHKRFVDGGMAADAAWHATFSDPAGREWAQHYRAPDANLTVIELAESARESAVEAQKMAARVAAGQPHNLHAAVLAEQQRGGGDYVEALERVTADPRCAGLVAKYTRAAA